MVNISKSDFLNAVRDKNKGEDEFLQAVEEVVETVWDYYVEHPQYRQAKIL